MSSTPSASFAAGELVLVPFGSLLYEARILKSLVKRHHGSDYYTYFIHYNGWGPKFDEWIDQKQILKDNEENRQLQKQKANNLKMKKAEEQLAKKGKKSGKEEARQGVHVDSSVVSANGGKRGKKRQRKLDGDNTVLFDEEDEEEKPKFDFQIKFPGLLKKQLLSDWENITRNQLCVTLPRNPSIRELLSQFASTSPSGAAVEYKSLGLGVCPSSSTLVNELNQGLINFFDRSCGLMLLYRMEKPQFEDHILATQASPSLVYGAEHFLRLFIKLPEMLNQSRRLRENDVKLLQAHVQDLVNFIAQRHSTLFTDLYEPVDEKYLKRVQA
jgi:mortality factor 4-like protein 1